MRSLKRTIFFRYAIAVTFVVFLIALIFVISLHSKIVDALIMIIGLFILLGLLAVITVWTQRTLSADLKEIGTALEKIVVENDLDKMPQPRLSELFDLAQDLDTIAARVRGNFELLAKERDRLMAILDNISAGIIVLGAGGKIDLINPVAEKILGTTRDYALGKTFTEIHHTPAIDKAIERSRRGAEVKEEVRISMPKRRSLRVLASPIRSEKGTATGVICILEDVTSRRRLERMRRDFVVNVSHELRTPVANLRALIEALLAGAWEEEDTGRKFLSDLDRESARLADILEDLLIISRLESEEMALMEETFDLRGLLEEAVSEKGELAARNEVEMVFSREGEGPKLKGDRKLVKTACVNLLDNAVKYNSPGGRVEITVDDGGEEVRINVSDTGIGIPEREQAKVFERFYRVDKARSRETGGTGLGLSIVKHVAEFHGGSVTVESTEGYGSTFTLSLPFASSLF